jgi:hypothetical protein
MAKSQLTAERDRGQGYGHPTGSDDSQAFGVVPQANR